MGAEWQTPASTSWNGGWPPGMGAVWQMLICFLDSGAATGHGRLMAVSNPTPVNKAKGTRRTGHFLTCTADKTTGGDKRLAAWNGSRMTDATINISDRSLVARHGSCMANTDLCMLGSGAAAGYGRLMAVANPTTINRTAAWQPPDVVGPAANAGTISTLGPAALACPGLCITPLVPGWESSTWEARLETRVGGILGRGEKEGNWPNVSSIIHMRFCSWCDKGEDFTYRKKKPSSSQYDL
ncbi:hypothetical protein E2C01_099180 [Portunus trituberculatus]|uniref:Uncharacterized protein n=1 Tax=Portunus trituberculatus TaxID=210409 RepID=A0A5B7KER5_PORTR|nr:hypothetical protein [Portunus trituberculatus]